MSAGQYTHIVVGGGSAGCVVANRLSAKRSNRVLLIEAGPDTPPDAVPADIADSYAARAAMNRNYFWDELRARLCTSGGVPGPEVRYEQARVLGGGSSVNGQVITRAGPADYDLWASLGATGWDWRSVLPSFKRVERDLDFPNDIHGSDGPIPVHREPRERWDGFTKAVARALEASGAEYHEDLNSGVVEGFGPLPINTHEGRRVSSAAGYLDRETRARENLHIRTLAFVSRLRFDGRTVTGVDVCSEGRSEAVAARTIVLCGGAVLSPALLMRSGVGPSAELSALGIPVVHNLAGVGQNLLEHPAVHVSAYLVPQARAGVHGGRHNHLYFRYASGVDGALQPDMLLNFASRSGWHALGQRLGTIQAYILAPFSRGYVRLASADPDVPPEVHLRLLDDRRDLDRLADGLRRAVSVFRSDAVARVALDPFATCYSDRMRNISRVNLGNRLLTRTLATLLDMPAPIRRAAIDIFVNDSPPLDTLLADDELLRDHVKRTVTGVWHPVGTCRLGAADNPLAVTDPRARLRGIDGLRIADASLMPVVPRCNTNLPAMMIGEHVSQMILDDEKA